MIVFFALVGVVCFTAGAFTVALLEVSAATDRRAIDAMARRDREAQR